MKTINKSMIYMILAVICLGLTAGCEEEEFDTTGLIVIQVIDMYSGEPVPNATVEIYGTEDDWAFEENRLRSLETNSTGEIVIKNLREGQYYFDVRKDNMDNWQEITNTYVMDGELSPMMIGIHESLNGHVSNVEGKNWELTEVRDFFGQDLSNDPTYSCLVGDEVTFTKAGYYGRNQKGTNCEPLDFTSIREGSWWASGPDLLYLLINNDEIYQFLIWDSDDNSFTAQNLDDPTEVLMRFELVQ